MGSKEKGDVGCDGVCFRKYPLTWKYLPYHAHLQIKKLNKKLNIMDFGIKKQYLRIVF